MIKVSSKAEFKNIESYLKRVSGREFTEDFDYYGRLGVEALSRATPVETGLTARSWGYKIIKNRNVSVIMWYNTNTADDGTPIPILIQYDHVTGTGGFVPGIDFINPAMKAVFDQIIAEIREKVKP